MRKLIFALALLSVLLLACRPAAEQAQPAAQPGAKQTAKTAPQKTVTSSAPAVPAPAEREQPLPAMQEVVEVDSAGFYPKSIGIKKGTKLSILFKVKTTGIQSEGLKFRSSSLSSPIIIPGGMWAMSEFTADRTFTISSYLPSSGARMADFTVNVT